MRAVICVWICFCTLGQSTYADTGDVFKTIAAEIEAGVHAGLTGGIITAKGELLLEAYNKGNDATAKHDIRSATKSITALLVGMLVDEDLLKNIDMPISKILTKEFAEIPQDSAKQKITVADLLTMRSGLACNDWAKASLGHEDKMYKTRDWAAFTLSQPLAYEVGDYFSYCTGGVILLGRIIEQLSGMSVPEYAKKLFVPLGIDADWAKTPTGHTDTGGHLRLSLRDLYKLGVLVEAGGRYADMQLVSKSWVKKMIASHTNVFGRREKYGYLWWYDSGNVKGTEVTLHFAHGNGGNFIFIIPELGLVAAFTGTNYNKDSQFQALQILTQKVIPALVN